MKTLFVLLIGFLLVGGCETSGPKRMGGALLGAAGGGLLGSQFGSGTGQIAATALGAVGGLLLGSSIGQSLDDVDRLKQNKAAHQAFEMQPSNVSTSWNNPETGNAGRITPTRTYQRGDGTYCREFTQIITEGGKSEQAFGTACRQPDGTWKVTG